MKKLLASGIFIFAGALFASEMLSSPDGTIKVSVDLEGKDPVYSVSRKGAELVKPSRLGLDFIGQERWENFKLKNVSRRIIDSQWKTGLYKKEIIRDHASEMTLELEDGKGRLLNLVFRAYDEGVAFRYVVPEQKGFDGFQLRGEFSEWRFNENSDGWFTTYESFLTSEEGTFLNRKIREISAGEIIGLPAIVNVASQRVALCEADLTNWAGLFYRVPKNGHPGGCDMLESAISPLRRSNACASDVAVICTTPAQSPWRVIICADGDIDLIRRNDIIMNLNPPPAEGMDFSWVRPGASSWDWWVESNNSLSTELTLKLIDFAAEMSWPYHTIDGGWYGWARRPNHGPNVPISIRKGFDLHKILAHAKTKNVGIWVWLHWEALEDNGVEETFAKFEEWGVKGVKIDFLDCADQKMVNWYEKTVRTAAKHKLMINYHGAYRPTGMNRTWPNQITREGIYGNEMTKFADSITPVHTATLPFTRFLLGPGDFTPGSFANVHTDKFVPQSQRGHRYGDESDHREIWAEEIGTRAHALALCIAYDSPLMTLCDWPERYRNAKGVGVLRNLPTVWKNTLPLAGEIGKYYVVAREAYDGSFYVAALGTEAKDLELELSFLPEDTEWKGTFYEDGPKAAADAKDISVSKRVVKGASKLTLKLAPEGGAVIIFKKD